MSTGTESIIQQFSPSVAGADIALPAISSIEAGLKKSGRRQ